MARLGSGQTTKPMGQRSLLSTDSSEQDPFTMQTGVAEYSARPDKAWSVLRATQRVQKLTPLAHDSSRRAGHTRFVCISGKILQYMCMYISGYANRTSYMYM